MYETMKEYINRRMSEELPDLLFVLEDGPRKTGSLGLNMLTIKVAGWPDVLFTHLYSPRLMRNTTQPELIYEQVIEKAVKQFVKDLA